MSRCSSCDAPVVWVCTEATATKPGRRMPLDAHPDDDTRALHVERGNILFTGNRTGDGTPIVRYERPGVGHHRSHFATCVNAAQHRKAKR